MYCGKCGREIPDDAGFCPCCGNATGNIAGDKSKGTSLNLSGMQQIAGGISVIIWIILDFSFFFICLSHYNSNMEAFDWVSDTAKMLGVIFYFLIAAAVLPDCIKAIKKFLEKKQDGIALIANGVSTLLYALLLQIGRWLFNDWRQRALLSRVRIEDKSKKKMGMDFFAHCWYSVRLYCDLYYILVYAPKI